MMDKASILKRIEQAERTPQVPQVSPEAGAARRRFEAPRLEHTDLASITGGCHDWDALGACSL